MFSTLAFSSVPRFPLPRFQSPLVAVLHIYISLTVSGHHVYVSQ